MAVRRQGGGPQAAKNAVSCITSGHNVTSCIIRTIIERYQQTPELEFPQLSKEIALALKDFKIELEPVRKYLDHLGKALESLYPVALRVDIETETPLVVHVRNPYMPLEIGLAWHPVFNAPYIPATAIKGVLAAYGEALCGMPARELFGDVEMQGALVITDALPTTDLALSADVITPHYKEPDFRETRAKPTPLVFPVVKPGATFAFYLASHLLKMACKAEVYRYLAQALQAGIGAKTRLGYGAIKVK
ncbi:type III-B CRISPR module RAMP protein Cmr6 [Pyrobaculum aerophilum]|uniref:type III-B CRISPR module RAMP protein Cmr6 n=1 Tax=Pyrobaculum aerophilum TaxID=13773 RepID=UPI0023F27369|nr:type III-B CRISPR module RAMP protein Cmr6 [Pyrobaculum aerophilum]MCX8137563.1 type III-B CRISPR module RAMP protein Cmr6 [Pyrobaculum aerophilum]